MREEPGLLEMIRAKFLFGILPPIVVGTTTAVYTTGEFRLDGLLLVLFIGLSLQISMHVFNDIYDTMQGSDTDISMDSDYSGGSGVLVRYPELRSKMLMIGRLSLAAALIGTLALVMLVHTDLWFLIILLVTLVIFLIIFYSASPVELAYRGLGEIAVWVGFGPAVVLIASIGQNLGIHPTVIAVTPITGFSTLFIAWMGELVDLEWDRAADKRGLVLILGLKKSHYVFLLIHIIALLNVVFVALFVFDPGYMILIALIPHAFLFPKYWHHVWNCDDKGHLEKAAKLNFWLYGLFSIALMVGFTINLFLF